MGVAVVMEQASIFFTLVSGWVTAARWTGYESQRKRGPDMPTRLATSELSGTRNNQSALSL